MAKTRSIELSSEHLLPEPTEKEVLMGNGPRQEVYSCMALFMDYWRMLDGLLYANDAFVQGVRNGELTAFQGLINGRPVTVEQAYQYGKAVGDHHKKMEEQSRADWEEQFNKSQNWLRVTTLAQTYLIWEDNIRDRFLEIIDFDHKDISIGKEIATVRSDTFGDLAKIRNSMWHAKSSNLGVSMFKQQDLKSIGGMVDFEKDEIMKVSAEQLPKLAFFISSKLQEFPVGYTLGVDERKQQKENKKKVNQNSRCKLLSIFTGKK